MPDDMDYRKRLEILLKRIELGELNRLLAEGELRLAGSRRRKGGGKARTRRKKTASGARKRTAKKKTKMRR